MTYFRKMKQVEIAHKTIFTSKERYLIDKQKCFVLDQNTDTNDSNSSGVNSDDENGPIRNEKWWNDIK